MSDTKINKYGGNWQKICNEYYILCYSKNNTLYFTMHVIYYIILYIIRYIYISYQYHLPAFVSIHRCLHSRSLWFGHWILILFCCHLLRKLLTRQVLYGLTRDTCQIRPILSTYASYIYLQT